LQTEARKFCEQFARQLTPFGARLTRVINTLSEQAERSHLTCLGELRSELLDVQYRYRSLQERVGNQQAYLLILGPLKSGKSTLMNAISATYVSEVSSLPAYPALVYVKNSEHSRYLATDYSGTTREFVDAGDMHDSIQQQHKLLADAILDAEWAQQQFDPKVHYPEAIKRFNIQLPAPALARSGTVLIDTPGLYSRMKFGYEQVTREFRNTAACAIFVVKGDNLFFEKVFDEFEELLASFNRIFLVANIDNSKQDLQANGSLAASLESAEPGKVIDAFKSLSVSAQLKQAIDDGRLVIYPIDLLSAASKRLTDERLEGGGDFDRFLLDLADYLNSSQYIQDFMADSLRMAEQLRQTIIEIADSEAAEQLLKSCADLRDSIGKKQKQQEALTKLKELDWSGAFWHLQEEKHRLAQTLAEDHTRMVTSLGLGLTAWMQTDGSWQELVDRHLRTIVVNETRREAGKALEHLASVLGGYSGGARLNMFQMGRLHQAGLQIEAHLPLLLQGLGQDVEVAVPELNLDTATVPLKRSLLDFVLFRKRARVGQRFFGAGADKKIPAAKKHKRMTGDAEEFIKQQLVSQIEEQLPVLQSHYIGEVIDRYQQQFHLMIQQQAGVLQHTVAQQIDTCQTDLKTLMLAMGMLEGTRMSATKLTETLGQIQTDFAIDLEVENGDLKDQPAAAVQVDVPADQPVAAPGDELDEQPGYAEMDSSAAGA
jgi:hypothetical protein